MQYRNGYYRKAGKTETGDRVWEVWENVRDYETGKPADVLIEGTAKDARTAIQDLGE